MAYLPLTNNPEEVFNITLFGTFYIMRQLWNEYGFWTLDIKLADETVLAYGVKLLAGHFLLRQYPHIPFDIKHDGVIDPLRNSLDEFKFEVTEKA